MCRSLVVGRIDQERDERQRVRDPEHLVPAVHVRVVLEHARQRVADDRPLLERRADRRDAMRNASVRKPVTPMTANVPRIIPSSGRVLMRMRYTRWT